MTAATEARENKKRRGWVLRILSKHRAPMNDSLLLDALNVAGHVVSMPTLHGDLEYLEEKGYVVNEENGEFGFTLRVAKLTAKGRDILEESIADPGIDLGHPGRA